MSMKNLDLQTNIIYEVIITSINEKGTPNAAPMGIILTEDDKVIIKPYKQSQTCKNLLGSNECVANFCTDIDLFVRCSLFKKELIDNDFTSITNSNVPILKNCKNRYLLLRIDAKKPEYERNRTLFTCSIIDNNLVKKELPKINRAYNSLIEILIHTTRIMAFKDEIKRKEEIKILLNLIEHHSNIVKRTSSNASQYKKLLKKIQKKIEKEMQIENDG